MKKSELLAFIEAFKRLRDGIDDKLASTSADVFPKLKHNGALIKVGTRVNFNGAIKRARVDMWDTELNSPDNAPNLWEDISYREGYRILNGPITAENTVCKGERCWFEDKLYESTIDNNVWLPNVYPAGWVEVK